MKLRDRALIGVLSVALIALSVMALVPLQSSADGPVQPSAEIPASRVYVEGVLGRATNASPFGARSAADRALVALLFRGLVRLGPGSAVVGDLAARWEVDATGQTWTFHLRPDQQWQDGAPITSEDVAFTVDVLSNPAYTGPGAESWRDVGLRIIDPLTIQLRPTTPLGGFLQAATQPIAPSHLLGGVPPEQLADDPFGTQPIGSGPFRLLFLDRSRARLAAATPVEPEPGIPGRPNFSTPRPTNSLATPPPTTKPDVAIPYLSNVELRFYDDAETVLADWAAGRLDAASGLPPAAVAELATSDDARVVRYPGTTLLAVTFNLRVPRKEFEDLGVRRALLEAIDRDAFVGGVLARLGAPAIRSSRRARPMFDADLSTR